MVIQIYKKGSAVFFFLLSNYFSSLHFPEEPKLSKINYTGALDVLNRLVEIKNNESILKSYLDDFQKYFNQDTIPPIVEIDELNKMLVHFDNICNYYANSIPKNAQSFILDRRFENQLFKDSVKQINDICSDTQNIELTKSFLKYENNQTLRFLLSNTQYICESIEHIEKDITELKSYCILPLINLRYLDAIINWENYLDCICKNNEVLQSSFDKYYQKEDTNWHKIVTSINWLIQYKRYENVLSLPLNFTHIVTTHQGMASRCSQIAVQIEKNKRSCESNLIWFLSWFSEGKKWLEKDIREIISLVNFYHENIEYLELWLNINKSLNKCQQLGLESFVHNVINDASISCAEYLDIYKKRFYSIWLDYFLPQLPTLYNLSIVELQKLQDDFKTQDKYQLELARIRIRQTLSNQLPNMSFTYRANDQLGILKREYNKKRRQLSLRRLFNQIPTIVQKIKPCMMMSPLSVSLFLENPDYQFDIVIFDEASQIKPENAIGSIIRGAQIIVAGDTHQLPPTSFFERMSDDNDYYESDDEEENHTIEESILEAASNILPEELLQWHYRSKHEHLIAFSNMKIYDNRLTTFPSAIDSEKDYGVEFEYVEGGVYDKGGKRYNINEAHKVVSLIFDHFRKYPCRSLGVIANSEAQANLIEEEVLKKRTEEPFYEDYFNAERIEPFFIKNLESVQGDERDTIIFSVGYGKDANGKMYQSFGPINKVGGERRLNVAVTRAKYNLKLVSSITAEDVAESSQKGPQLLKSYLDFAKRGIVALINDNRDFSSQKFDSPFEESVYDYIKELGYSVQTQVGCAGYRIDLGIKDPDAVGRYVLAIECDGASYHSSSYARERDRLRQEILENMGWSFHRIWSTEWIKHTAIEKQKLRIAIEKAIECKDRQYIDVNNKKAEPLINSPAINHQIMIFDELNSKLSDAFEPYNEFDISRYKGSSDTTLIKKILEVEAPIHIDLLCKKMAPFYGREKVTSVVRRRVVSTLGEINDVDLEDFWNYRNNIVGTYSIVGNFIYKCPKENKYKIRQVAGRDIEMICPEELRDLMVRIAISTVGITPENLENETGHALGYKQCKERISGIVHQIFTSLTEDGILSISSSGWVVVNKS